MKKTNSPCPCGSGQTYAHCCGPWHQGEAAPTPEALMRSRYSAYALGLTDYLCATWAPETCPPDLDAHTPPQPKWVGLIVHGSGIDGQGAWVNFTARGKNNGKAFAMTEKSRFEQRAGRWLYVSGEVKD